MAPSICPDQDGAWLLFGRLVTGLEFVRDEHITEIDDCGSTIRGPCDRDSVENLFGSSQPIYTTNPPFYIGFLVHSYERMVWRYRYIITDPYLAFASNVKQLIAWDATWVVHDVDEEGVGVHHHLTTSASRCSVLGIQQLVSGVLTTYNWIYVGPSIVNVENAPLTICTIPARGCLDIIRTSSPRLGIMSVCGLWLRAIALMSRWDWRMLASAVAVRFDLFLLWHASSWSVVVEDGQDQIEKSV